MDYSTAQASELLALPKEKLVEIIFQLADEIGVMKIQLTSLLEKQKKSTDESPPPGQTGTQQTGFTPKTNVKKKKKKKGARQKRSVNVARKKALTPTHTRIHSFECCPQCSGDLGRGSIGYERDIIDLPFLPVTITRHVVLKKWCGSCKQRFMPQVDFSHSVVGHGQFGIGIHSMVSFLREECRAPIETIQKYLSTMHTLDISVGGITRLLHTTATVGTHLYDTIKNKIRDSSYTRADETGGRENGRNGYFWNFSTDTLQYITYRKTRSGSVVSDVLGESYEGVIGSDFYAAYNIHEGLHQRCWVHLLRDVDDLQTAYPQDREIKKWHYKLHVLYNQARHYQDEQRAQFSEDELWKDGSHRLEQQKKYEERLRIIAQEYGNKDSPMGVLCARMLNYLPELFVFIRYPLVDAHNNGAERAVRHTVIARKISGGTRSSKGSETKSILASLFGTWRLQGKNAFLECQKLLRGEVCQLT